MVVPMPTTDDDPALQRLRLVGPHGDPLSQAMWLPLRRACAFARESLDSLWRLLRPPRLKPGGPYGFETFAGDAERWRSRLADDLEHAIERTPCAWPGMPCMKSREKFLRDYTMDCADTQPESPERAYRHYLISVRPVELKDAHHIIKLLGELLRETRPSALPESDIKRPSLSHLRAQRQREHVIECRKRIFGELQVAKQPIVDFGRAVKRLHTMEKLGWKITK